MIGLAIDHPIDEFMLEIPFCRHFQSIVSDDLTSLHGLFHVFPKETSVPFDCDAAWARWEKLLGIQWKG